MLCGVLALQGAFAAHQRALADCGVECRLVRTPRQFEGVDALVLPGGESTTMVRLLHTAGLWQPLAQRTAQGLPVLATCAGLILLARDIHNAPQQERIALLDVEIERNGYGSQLDSHHALLDIEVLGPPPLPVFFIRAPRVLSHDNTVEVLCYHRGDPVLLRQNHVLAATFHSELTDDTRLHRYFLSSIGGPSAA